MNLEYIKEVIIPQRKKEIEEGKNAMTRQPVYVVYDLIEQFYEGHGDIYGLASTCLKNSGHNEHGYFDRGLDVDEIEFNQSDKGMKEPCEMTRFFTDRFVAVFLTYEGAEKYMKYQKHNLTNPYIYVHYSGYGNREMDSILCNS